MLGKHTALQDILKNPALYFKSPEEVVKTNALSREAKLKVLESWKYDQQELLVATEENMNEGKQDEVLFDEIVKMMIKLK